MTFCILLLVDIMRTLHVILNMVWNWHSKDRKGNYYQTKRYQKPKIKRNQRQLALNTVSLISIQLVCVTPFLFLLNHCFGVMHRAKLSKRKTKLQTPSHTFTWNWHENTFSQTIYFLCCFILTPPISIQLTFFLANQHPLNIPTGRSKWIVVYLDFHFHARCIDLHAQPLPLITH